MINDHRLTPREARRLQELKDKRAAMRAILANLDDPTLEALIRRSRYPAQDAYTTSTAGDGGGNDVSKPTEAAALRQDPTDQTRRSILELLGLLEVADDALQAVEQRRDHITTIDDKIRGRINTVDICAECGQPAPKVHRIDGQPYCWSTCYQRVNRRMRNQSEVP